MNKLPLEEVLYRRTLKQGWIIVFADLLALLLTFFVLIFSMNAIQYEDWQSVVTSLSDHLNPSRAEISKKSWAGRETTKVYDPFAISLDYLHAVLEQKVEAEEMLNGIVLYRLEDSLVITLPVEQLYESREIRLSRRGKMMLGELSLLMRQLSNRISVIGHTDLTVPNSRFFSSSWDLSLNRAVVVAGEAADGGRREHVGVGHRPAKVGHETHGRIDNSVVPGKFFQPVTLLGPPGPPVVIGQRRNADHAHADRPFVTKIVRRTDHAAAHVDQTVRLFPMELVRIVEEDDRLVVAQVGRLPVEHGNGLGEGQLAGGPLRHQITLLAHPHRFRPTGR